MPMYRHMVVIPAHCREVVGVMGAAVCESFDVVGLEAVATVASVYDASSVAVSNMMAESWRDCACCW